MDFAEVFHELKLNMKVSRRCYLLLHLILRYFFHVWPEKGSMQMCLSGLNK